LSKEYVWSKGAAWFDRMDPVGPKEDEEQPIEELDITPRISPWIEDMYNPLALPGKPDDPYSGQDSMMRPDNGHQRTPRDIMNSVIMSNKEKKDGNDKNKKLVQEAQGYKSSTWLGNNKQKCTLSHEASFQGDVDFALEEFIRKQSASSSWRSIISHDLDSEEAELPEYWFPTLDDAFTANKHVLESMPGTGNHEIGHGGTGLIESSLKRVENIANFGQFPEHTDEEKDHARGREDEELYGADDTPDVFDLAGHIASAVTVGHGFENGNHRTAFNLTHEFLEKNGFGHVTAQDDEDFARKVLGLTEHGRAKLDDPFRDPSDIQPQDSTAKQIADMFRERHLDHLEQEHPDYLDRLEAQQKQAKIAGEVEHKVCRFCKRPAVRLLVWANGNSILPVCGKHIGQGNRMIKDEKSEVVDRVDLTPDSRGNFHDFKETDPKYERHNMTK